MKTQTKGWVIMTPKHSSTGRKFISDSTFNYTRKGAIKSFVEGSMKPWRHWKNKYNFRAVRATRTIITASI